MKRVLKGVEPPTLVRFKTAAPGSTWEQMRNHPHYSGQQAYQDCRSRCIADQHGLCAYCEIDIRDNNPLRCRVEHFHSKSDTTTNHNWALDWQNMLGVCNGGDNPHLTNPGFHMSPTTANLSCDAHKDRMIQQQHLPLRCEGWILNPQQLQSFPALFRLDKATGFLHPDANQCAISPPFANNQHATNQLLVQHTIDMLNLNCDRLAQGRLRLIRDIERKKKEQRQAGYTPQQGLMNLAQRYFQIMWPGFFTTIRFCLGHTAETYLKENAYQG